MMLRSSSGGQSDDNCASVAAQEIQDSRVSTTDILTIQRRRARRQPPEVEGLDDVVRRLATLSDPVVHLAVYSNNGEVLSVVYTDRGDLIGCVLGPDRSHVERPQT